MPKQNRPVVRDGRLQQPARKRTDRSYLGSPAPARVSPPDETLFNPADAPEEAGAEPDAVADVIEAVADAAPAGTAAAAFGQMPVREKAAQPQSAVRRKREIDLEELARADTRYAIHELRRIAILAALVVVTLIVLTFVLR